MKNLKVYIFMLGLLLWTIGRAQTPGMASTVAGAISDEAPHLFTVDGVAVKVWDSARNAESSDFYSLSNRTYRYATSPTLIRRASGKLVDVVPLGERSRLSMTFQMPTVNESSLVARVRAKLNPNLKNSALSLLEVYDYSFEVDGLSARTFSGGGLMSLGSLETVTIEVPAKEANDFANAISKGQLGIRVRAKVLQKMSAMSTYRLDWKRVQSSKLYQKYSGPSGPTVVTANQAAELSSKILNEVKAKSWVEGASTADQQKIIDWLKSALINRTPIERDLSSKEWTKGLAVDVADFQKLTDITRELATDSKNLNHDEWCKKYKYSSKEHSTSSSGDDYGLVIPIKTVTLGLSSSSKDGSDDSFQESEEQEDCGKKAVENQFKYEFKGEKYVPKSIYVYQNIKGSAASKESASNVSWRLDQRMAVVDLPVQMPK